MFKKTVLLFVVLLGFRLPNLAQPNTYNPADIKIALQKLNTLGTVLYIAAHPDDENTRLLSYLAREKNIRTCYLSLNRGEGGQNLIGKEQGPLLGIIRTNELMQARSIDGAEQFFTRVIDFGYSKTPEETFSFWNHDSVLADVVYIIRKVQPDVIITRFPTTGEGGHGHHTASAILAGEAFTAAANPSMFPWQLTSVKAWQAKSLYWNTFNFGDNNTQREDQLKVDAGVFNSYLGKGYGEIAAQSRSQHKSQGFGVPVGRGSNIEYLKNIAGDTSCTTLFCNHNFTWSRLRGSSKIKAICEKALFEFDFNTPEKSLPVLIEAYKEISLLKDDYWRVQKLKEVQQLILACAGIWFESSAGNYFVTPGDSLLIRFNAISYKGIQAEIKNINFNGYFDSTFSMPLKTNVLFKLEKALIVPTDADFSFHYWLKEKPLNGRYNINNLNLIGKPLNDAAMQVSFQLSIQDLTLSLTAPVKYKWTDPVEAEKYRDINIVPPAVINFNEPTCLVINNQPRKIKFTVKSFANQLSGTISIAVPSGFLAEPSNFTIDNLQKGETMVLETTLQTQVSRKPVFKEEPLLQATFTSGKYSYSYSLQEINYHHIPYQLVFTNAALKIASINLSTKRKNIAYIEGAGDDVAACLQQAGYKVTLLKEENLKNDNIGSFDAIIAGIRAYNTNDWLFNYQKKLMQYVFDGGNYIVQYNTNNNLGKIAASIGPYPFKISRNRVTDEHAEMTMVNATDVVFTSPNKITSDDFNNWVQERGIYFASEIDSNYRAVLTCHDKGEQPLNGSLIISHYGKGNFVYSGLVFFRQLPAGISGAYRLLANLIDLPTDNKIDK
jgi:LmbE family N-acetylglucosaminyl deacetylase